MKCQGLNINCFGNTRGIHGGKFTHTPSPLSLLHFLMSAHHGPFINDPANRPFINDPANMLIPLIYVEVCSTSVCFKPAVHYAFRALFRESLPKTRSTSHLKMKFFSYLDTCPRTGFLSQNDRFSKPTRICFQKKRSGIGIIVLSLPLFPP